MKNINDEELITVALTRWQIRNLLVLLKGCEFYLAR